MPFLSENVSARINQWYISIFSNKNSIKLLKKNARIEQFDRFYLKRCGFAKILYVSMSSFDLQKETPLWYWWKFKTAWWQKKIQNDKKKISVKYCMPFILNVTWISLYFVGDAYRNNLRFLVFDWVVILCINNLNTKTRFYALFCKIIKPIDMTSLKKLLINRNNWSYT